jgi:hypothetical protein
MMLARPFRPLVVLPAVVLLAAGCAGGIAGSGSPAPASSGAVSGTPADNGIAALSESAILAKAQAALRSAKSVRMRLVASNASKGAAFDIRYSGTKATGTLATAPGQSLELRRLGDSVYLKGSQRFWREYVGENAATLLTGKWLKTSMTDERFSETSQVLDLSEGLLEPDGEIAKGGRTTIRGTPAIGLVDRSDGSILYIATTGPAYPLQTVPTPGAAGRIDFLDYGKPVSVQAPPAELVIDTSELPGS